MLDETTTPPPVDDDAPPEDDVAGLPLDLLRRYSILRGSQKISEAEAAAFKDEATAIEAQLIEAFTEAGLQNINLDGKTIFLHRTTFAQRKNGATAEDVKAALRAAGAGDLVQETVNSQTLGAWVRELVDAEEDGRGPGLPPEAAEVLELGEKYAVRIKASAARRR